MLGMVLVNMQASEADSFTLLAHAEWNGLTLADLVFPMFLLASGLALPLALDRRSQPAPAGKLVRRAVLLYLLGLALGWVVHITLQIAEIRFTGVLERIAIVYLICAVTCRAMPGWKGPLLLALMLMAAHGALLYVSVPGDTGGSMTPGQGLSGWLDRAILPGRLYRDTWDPEGPLSTLSSIATGLIGVTVQRLTLASARPIRLTAGGAVLCLVLATIALLGWPINKALWTPSFALVTAGIGLALLTLLRAIWPRIGEAAGARFLATLGQCALTLYVVHSLLTAILFIPVKGDATSWALSYAALRQLGLSPASTSLLFATIAGAISVAITFVLRWRGWLLRL
jgi:predicted acyltransferase